MPDTRPVIWLAGFPSSGNIKVQIALANLLLGRVTSISDLDAKIPPMGPAMALPSAPAQLPANVVFTHHVATEALISLGRPAAIVYVVRDPLDAGISSANGLLPRAIDMGKADNGKVERARRTLIDFYVRFGTYEPYVRCGYGTWSSHVLSWLNAARSAQVPMHIVRFEALRDDGRATLRELATFLGMSVDDAAIDGALENCSLAASRAMEERAIADRAESRFFKRVFSVAYERGWRHLGGGGSGYARSHLSPAQWEAARHVFGPTAAAIGLDIER
jgi:Sulfotransferase domain